MPCMSMIGATMTNKAEYEALRQAYLALARAGRLDEACEARQIAEDVFWANRPYGVVGYDSLGLQAEGEMVVVHEPH